MKEMRQYRFADGTFRFWLAWQSPSQAIVFRVRADRDAEERAGEKGIAGSISPASDSDVESWLAAHPERQVLG